MSEDEVAVITDETEMGKTAAPISNTEDAEHFSDENISSEDEIVAASRYEFEIKPDHFIFDFKDVESEEDMIQEEEPNEDEGNEDGEEEEEDENEKDGMEDEAADDDNLTEQQQLEAENEAKAAMEKNISRRMGWFDMIRRLEKKVANEKKMAQNGGYDLNDPFIDDDILEKQTVCTSIPEPPPYQVMRFISSEADSGNAPVSDAVPDSTKRKKGEKYVLTEKQKQQLASWNPSPTVEGLLAELRVKSEPILNTPSSRNQMPSELDDVLEKIDIEVTSGNRNRPSALVLAISEILPFHPRTISLRLRLLQRRREYTEINLRYETESIRFKEFMSNWARNNNGQPKWTMETRMKMAEMYQLLRERVDRDHQLTKMEKVDHNLDFDTEFSSLSSSLLPFFSAGRLTIMDLQQEFQSAAEDEELAAIISGEEKRPQGAATSRRHSRQPQQSQQSQQSPLHDDQQDQNSSGDYEEEDYATITTVGAAEESSIATRQSSSVKESKNGKTPLVSPVKLPHRSGSRNEDKRLPSTDLLFWRSNEKVEYIRGMEFKHIEFDHADFV